MASWTRPVPSLARTAKGWTPASSSRVIFQPGAGESIGNLFQFSRPPRTAVVHRYLDARYASRACPGDACHDERRADLLWSAGTSKRDSERTMPSVSHPRYSQLYPHRTGR